ncbi:unnamed protein product [Effrenium voratum]|uniref:Uncharacterized protein n=1 Tax=Effrenium voratum TaxID=2562239 RepID=A0AA36JIZ4_9DINO|nr:unnamed protein product [Effrenium voratum]
MAESFSLASFLQAARPDWKDSQLAAVEEKLEKVGVTDVLELVRSLRGRSDQRLNNRLKAVGEKCFTSETLSALRRQVRAEPTLRGAEKRAANARLLAASSAEFDDDDDENEDAEAAPLLAAPRWNPAAAAHARREAAKVEACAAGPSAPLPTSKADMVEELEKLGLEASAAPAHALRAALQEVRRLRALPAPELQAAAEAQGLQGASEELLRQMLETSFPDLRREVSPEEECSFQILTPSPEPLSLSTLFLNSEADLLMQCKARNLRVEGMESRGKGFLAVLLKMESRREYLQSLAPQKTIQMATKRWSGEDAPRN